MKQVFSDKIINIDDNFNDNQFLIKKLNWEHNINFPDDVEIVFMSDLLEKKINVAMLAKSEIKPATWGMVYSPNDELDIFNFLFNGAISKNKKIHIVGVTLDDEIKILEKYYNHLGFFSEEINCFELDFSVPLVTVSVKIENFMYRGSDYKRLGNKIFFNPPIRESGQVKSMFKGINRGVIAGIYIDDFNNKEKGFLQNQILTEHILPITMSKILNYNLSQIGFHGEEQDFIISY